MEEGHIVVDSIVPIRLRDITRDLARESGFASVKDLLQIAKHGSGQNVYLIRFHYLAPGAWDVPKTTGAVGSKGVKAAAAHSTRSRSDVLRRIRSSRPPKG